MTTARYRIAMFSRFFPPEYSGTALQAIALAKQLKARGHYIEFVTQRWPGLSPAADAEGFHVSRLEAGHGRKHREFRYWWNVWRFLQRRKGDFDLLHSHGAYYTDAIIGLLSERFGAKSLAKASLAKNDLAIAQGSLDGRLHRYMLSKIDACIAISRDLEAEFHTAGVPPERTYFLPNGVDTERFRPATREERKDLKRRLGLPVDRKIVLFVGVFDARKNIEWLMHEWRRSRGFGLGALMLAIGPQSRDDIDGHFRQSLRSLASQSPRLLRVEDPTEAIEDYYRAADLFVLPSYREGLPNALLEAMSSGLPAAAANASGTRELVIEGETGHLFDIDDTPSLKAAVEKGLGPDASRLGQAARALAEDRYSISRLARQYEALYGQLLRGKT